MIVDCPKCASTQATYRADGPDLVLRCLCGYHKVVYTTLGTAEIMHSDAGTSVRLPKQGTHLRKTLMAVECLEIATTAEITLRLHELRAAYSASDVASYLTILRAKGLVDTTTSRRGVAGGSTWVLTDAAEDLLTETFGVIEAYHGT